MITSDDVQRYNRIIFEPCDAEAEIENLDIEQK